MIMPFNDKAQIWRGPRLVDVHIAFGLLTRLPLPCFGTKGVEEVANGSAANSAWTWPLVGAFLGALSYLVGAFALALGLPLLISGSLAVAAMVIVTGAFHEDGLADSADGLWGGYKPARRLEIMKDSHIGTYGVLALILVIGLRIISLGALLQNPMAFAGIVALGALSRTPMILFMALMPGARNGGLSLSVGRPSVVVVGMALALSAALAFGLLGVQALWLCTTICGVTALWALVAWRKIGGQTGDVLGASQQLSEVAGLLTLVSLWA